MNCGHEKLECEFFSGFEMPCPNDFPSLGYSIVYCGAMLCSCTGIYD
jgi:hypothetical protein